MTALTSASSSQPSSPYGHVARGAAVGELRGVGGRLVLGDLVVVEGQADHLDAVLAGQELEHDHEPDAGREQAQQPAGGQVLQALLQGGP